MNKITTAIQAINQERINKGSRPLYLSLKVGDIVYTKYNGCIMQAKITEIESRIHIGGSFARASSETKYKAILPTGETICREYGMFEFRTDYCRLYPSVDMARVNKAFIMDIDATCSETEIIAKALHEECNGVRSKDGLFCFYLRAADPKEIGYHYAIYAHNDNDIVFETRWDGYPNGTIAELEEKGLYTTYGVAYYAFKPKVVCFSTEDEKPVKTQKKRLTIEFEFECADEEILSEIEDMAGAYNATISISKV